MTRTSASMSKARDNGWSIALPHSWSPESGRSERIYLEKTDQTMQSAGGVVMSARDAQRWLEFMVEDGRVGGKQVFPAAVIRSTRQPLADLDESRDGFTRRHYGLGWYLGTYRDEVMLQHFGGFPGARAHVSYLPDRHAGVAVFINDSSVSAPVVDLVAKLVYDRVMGRPDALEVFDAAVATLATEGPARFTTARNERAGRPWTFSRPPEAYAGTYFSPEMGTMEITVAGANMYARIGLLKAVGIPHTERDTMRVEFAPGQGEPVRFEVGDGTQPSALSFGGIRFTRR